MDKQASRLINAQRSIARFQQQLEAQVKRHNPEDWAFAVAQRAKNPYQSRDVFYGLHELAHSLEANCAYARGHRTEPVTEKRARSIINVYRANDSPYLNHILQEEDDVDLFFQVMARQQLELQAENTDLKNSVGRFFLLYCRDSGMRNSQSLFKKHHSMDFDAWATLCLGGFGAAAGDPYSRIRYDRYLSADSEFITPDTIERFAKLTAATPPEIGHRYRQRRAPDQLRSPHLEICIRSQLLETPLVSFGERHLLAPIPHLLLRYTSSGLDRHLKELDEDQWTEEMGNSFARYVSEIASVTFGTKPLRPDTLKRASGQRCDLAFDLKDCVVLIECKATRFAQRLIVKDRLQNDSSAKRIQEGVVQLIETAAAVQRNEVFPEAQSGRKPIIALIVTLGELFAPNSNWYWDHVISPPLVRAGKLEADFPAPLSSKPQILSIHGFELLNQVLRLQNPSLVTLQAEQVERNRLRQGDWSLSLRKSLGDAETRLAELEGAFLDFQKRLERKFPGFARL